MDELLDELLELELELELELRPELDELEDELEELDELDEELLEDELVDEFPAVQAASASDTSNAAPVLSIRFMFAPKGVSKSGYCLRLLHELKVIHPSN
ncbi:MAG: hypothetical protein RL497_2753 [Pseudomonadota bacterium]